VNGCDANGCGPNGCATNGCLPKAVPTPAGKVRVF
jgi:hypothetical protein